MNSIFTGNYYKDISKKLVMRTFVAAEINNEEVLDGIKKIQTELNKCKTSFIKKYSFHSIIFRRNFRRNFKKSSKCVKHHRVFSI